MKGIKKDAINILVSFVAMLFVWGIYVAVNEVFPSVFFVVVFLLVLIFLEVSDLNKKK